jgi:Transposase DDE domain
MLIVDVREIDARDGVSPIHWRLLTSHTVTFIVTARKMIDHYRKRWIIEDYFRTIKSAGFHIEDADIADPRVMLKFTALAAIAAVTVTQLLRARDNSTGQSLMVAFDPDDQPVLAAICKDYEGISPIRRQTNPHPPDTLAFATWVIARLGGWTGNYGKPSAQVLNRGLQRYFAIKYGSVFTRRLV